MLARGTVPGMRQQREDEIVAAYANGWDMAQIESRYDVSRAEVERLVAGGEPVVQANRRPGLNSRGNRVAIGVAVGFVVQVFAGLLGGDFVARMSVWAVAAVITYVLLTAAFTANRSADGHDRQG